MGMIICTRTNPKTIINEDRTLLYLWTVDEKLSLSRLENGQIDLEELEYEMESRDLAELHINQKVSLLHCKNGVIPSEIPRDPKAYYGKSDTWVSYCDFPIKAASLILIFK